MLRIVVETCSPEVEGFALTEQKLKDALARTEIEMRNAIRAGELNMDHPVEIRLFPDGYLEREDAWAHRTIVEVERINGGRGPI